MPRIEAEAPGDYDWIHRPSGSIFQEADTPEQPSSAVVRYRGDFIRLVSPQKEWLRAVYECGFDADAKQVAYVRLKLGILGKQSAVPVVPPAQAGAPGSPTAARGPVPGLVPQQQAAGTPSANPAAPQSDVRRVREPSEVDIRQVSPTAKPKT